MKIDSSQGSREKTMFIPDANQGGFLRFRLFGFPVAIHWFFWVLAAFIGGALDATSPESFRRTRLYGELLIPSPTLNWPKKKAPGKPAVPSL